MSNRKQTVERYFDGFRQGDHAAILACLAEDVAWDLPGFRHLRGKADFDSEIENPGFTGRPALKLDRLIEEGEAVVAIGEGAATTVDGATHRFAFCDVFTFEGALIARVESYLVPLTGEAREGPA